MATGIQGAIGIGNETTWGTAVPSTRFVTGQESISEEIGRLRESMSFGTRSVLPADAGRKRYTGGITEIGGRPAVIGELLRAAIGAPVTTGAGPYEHVFTPQVAKFSEVAALPPYSATIKRGSLIHRYGGGQLNRLTLRQAAAEALMVDTDWIFKDKADVAAETITLDTSARFRFQHLAITRNAVAFPFVEDLTVTIENNLASEEVFDQGQVISAVDFDNQLNIGLAMTVTFRNADTYNDFANSTTQPWVFTWTLGTNVLAISIPKLQIDTWSAPISGPGRMTISIDATAEYDSGAGHEAQITLTNDVVSY